MKTRFARRRVWISHMLADEPEEFIILSAFKDAGEYFYRLKSVEMGTIVDLPLRSLNCILHRKTKVIDARKKFRLVKMA